MTDTPTPLTHKIAAFVAVMTGVAVPLRASGVATEQAALGLALMGALALVASHSSTRTLARQALVSTQAKVIALVFVGWAVTVFFSFDPMGSLKIGTRTGLFILAAMTVWAALASHDDAKRLMWKILVVTSLGLALAAFLALNGVPMIVSILKGHIIESERPIFAFKAFSTSAMCLIPAVALAGRKLDGNWRWAGYAFAPLALALMILTLNRSGLAGFMAMAITGVVLLAVTKRHHVKALLSTAVAIVFGIVAWVSTREWLVIKEHEQLGIIPIKGTYLPVWLVDSHRQYIWKFAYEHFLNHPWVGNGIDQLNRLPGAKASIPGLEKTAALVPSHPHNWSLEILSETGLLGFSLVLLALGFVAWRLLKDYLASGDEANLALLTLMAGFWSSALFNFSIWASWWQLTFFILFAIIASGRVRT